MAQIVNIEATDAQLNTFDSKPKKRKKEPKSKIQNENSDVEVKKEIQDVDDSFMKDDNVSNCDDPDKRTRRSPSNDSEFSGFEDSSNTETSKKMKLINSLSKESAFDLFYKIKVKTYKKSNPTSNMKQLRALLYRKWSRFTIKKKQKFCSLYKESADDGTEEWRSSSSSKSSQDEADNLSETSSASSAQSKRSKKSHDGDDPAPRGTYRLPRNEKVCCKCEAVALESSGADMVKCKGVCHSFFHLACVGLVTKPELDFKCDECQSGVHHCFICKVKGHVAPEDNKKDSKCVNGKGQSKFEKIGDNGRRSSVLSDLVCKAEPSSPFQSSETESSQCPQSAETEPSQCLQSAETEPSQCPQSAEVSSTGSAPVSKGDGIKPKQARSSRLSLPRRSRGSCVADIDDKIDMISDDGIECHTMNPQQTDINKDEFTTITPVVNPSDEDSKREVSVCSETVGCHESAVDCVSKESCPAAQQQQTPAKSDDGEVLRRCGVNCCGKFYHLRCVLKWPQVAHGWQDGKVRLDTSEC